MTSSELPTAALRAEGLVKRFGDRRAVDEVSFTIAQGESYGLLGPNGAGKTTTISLVLALLRRDAGSVHVGGADLDADPGEVKRAIGYVPQEVALYNDLTARENLDFFARLYDLPTRERAERITQALELIGLEDRADERIDTYSGGMKRRVNIAAGLLHRPRLLILDEPTVGVDPQSRNAILEGVAALNDDGMAILYTSHYMEEVERLCHRVGIIDEGKLIAEGTRRELVESIGEQDRVDITIEGEVEQAVRALKEQDGVDSVTAQPVEGSRGTVVRILASRARNRLARLLDAADTNGVAISSVEVFEPDLEAVFLHLTGRALRD